MSKKYTKEERDWMAEKLYLRGKEFLTSYPDIPQIEVDQIKGALRNIEAEYDVSTFKDDDYIPPSFLEGAEIIGRKEEEISAIQDEEGVDIFAFGRGNVQGEFKAYKVRLYPNAEQREILEKTFGCVRKIWNEMLDEHQ